MKKISVLAVMVLLMALSVAALAKEGEDNVAALQKQLESLQKTYMTNNADTASAVARINTINDEFTSVKGDVEANTHRIKTQNEELMKLITDLQTRLQAIEDRIGVFSGQITSALGKVAPAAAAEAEQYQRGIDLADSGKYLESASAFESFIQKYPKSKQMASAYYRVADCFYSSRDYKRAIREFQNYIEKYPKDSKIPDAVYKQGNSFYDLGMLEESKAFFEKVVSSYPSSSFAPQAKAKLLRIKERKEGVDSGATSGSSYPAETIQQKQDRMIGGKKDIEETSSPVNQKTKEVRQKKEF